MLGNLRNTVIKDDASGQSAVISTQPGAGGAISLPTARWGQTSGYYHWRIGAVESTAWVLMAMLEIDPQNDLIVPAMNWLVKNRRAGQWNNTRDTAMAVLALNQYLQVSGELAQLQDDSEYVVQVNGSEALRYIVRGASWLTEPSHFVVDPALLKSGSNTINISRISGTGPLYFLAQAEFLRRKTVLCQPVMRCLWSATMTA